MSWCGDGGGCGCDGEEGYGESGVGWSFLWEYLSVSVKSAISELIQTHLSTREGGLAIKRAGSYGRKSRLKAKRRDGKTATLTQSLVGTDIKTIVILIGNH